MPENCLLRSIFRGMLLPNQWSEAIAQRTGRLGHGRHALYSGGGANTRRDHRFWSGQPDGSTDASSRFERAFWRGSHGRRHRGSEDLARLVSVSWTALVGGSGGRPQLAKTASRTTEPRPSGPMTSTQYSSPSRHRDGSATSTSATESKGPCVWSRLLTQT